MIFTLSFSHYFHVWDGLLLNDFYFLSGLRLRTTGPKLSPHSLLWFPCEPSQYGHCKKTKTLLKILKVWFVQQQSVKITYILWFPAATKSCFLGNIFNIYEVGYLGIFQSNSSVNTWCFQWFASLWTECQIWHITNTSDSRCRRNQAQPIFN